MKYIKTYEFITNLFGIHILNPNTTFYFWVSPENKIYKVPEYGHTHFIKKFFNTTAVESIYQQAYKNDWVRGQYLNSSYYFGGSLDLSAISKERIKEILETKPFKDFLSDGNFDITVSWGETKKIMQDNYLFFTNNRKKVRKRRGNEPEILFIWDWIKL